MLTIIIAVFLMSSRGIHGTLDLSSLIMTPFDTVPYQGIRIKIFKNPAGHFFYSPACFLMPNSTTIHFNNRTNLHSVMFKVKLWDRDLESHVKTILFSENSTSNQPAKVLTIPFSHIRFSLRGQWDGNRIAEDWIPIGSYPETVSGSIRCTSETRCEEIVNSIKSEQFASHLQLAFAIPHSLVRRAAKVVVKTVHLRASPTFMVVASRPKHQNFACMKYDDFYDMVYETVREAIDSVIQVEEIVEDNELQNFIGRLSTMLRHNISSTADLNTHWDDVFWRVEGDRPDRQAFAFTELLNQNKLWPRLVMESGNISELVAGGTSGLGETFVRLITAARNSKEILWTGERFVVKPMEVSCVNLTFLLSKETIGQVKGRISGSEEDYSTVASLPSVHYDPSYGKPDAAWVEKQEQATADIASLQNITADMKQFLVNLQSRNAALEADVANLSKNSQPSEEQLLIGSKVERAIRDIMSLRNVTADFRQDFVNLRSQNAAITAEVTILRSNSQSLEEQRRLQSRLEQATADIISLRNLTANGRHDVANIRIQNTAIAADVANIKSSNARLEKQLPIGSVVAYQNVNPPTCWLECNGQSFSSTRYPQLYSVLSSTIVPDLSGSFLLARSSSYYFGTKGGEEYHTLTTSEIPRHSHAGDDNSWFMTYYVKPNETKNNFLYTTNIAWTKASDGPHAIHSHTQYTGGDGSHNNMPPYISVLYMIRAC